MLSTALDRAVLEDFAEMVRTELVTIDNDSTPAAFRRELRWNAAYHRLAAPL
jgi:L-arabinose isomerase